LAERWRQESVLCSFGFCGIEAANDTKRRIGNDTSLDLRGSLLCTDQNGPARPAALGNLQQAITDRRPPLTWRVTV
jgi:hypothetical protein